MIDQFRTFMASLGRGSKTPSSLPMPHGGAAHSGAGLSPRARARSGVATPLVAPGKVANEAAAAPLPRPEQSARRQIFQAFDASMPVENRHGLTGRGKELDRLIDGVIHECKHAMIFGARGSGKTSLARVFGDIADEQRFTVVYNSCGGDLTFSSLFRPYVEELVGLLPGISTLAGYQRLAQSSLDPRELGIFLADAVDRPTVFMIDEFDRITGHQTKQDVADFMKMLSDMRSSVRVVIVGIAGNLGDLLEGHPSLRRHMVSLPIGGISAADQKGLLSFCCSRAAMEIDPAAADLIVKSAMGSPFHLRLFGLQCALVAHQSADGRITEAIVKQGLSRALQDWAQFAPEMVDHYTRLVRGQGSLASGIAAACVIAAYGAQVSEADVAQALVRITGQSDQTAQAIAADTMHQLMPVLQATSSEGRYMFTDTLAPQFFMMMHNGIEFPGDRDAVRRGSFDDDLQVHFEAVGHSQ
jgi:hypothetical protein